MKPTQSQTLAFIAGILLSEIVYHALDVIHTLLETLSRIIS